MNLLPIALAIALGVSSPTSYLVHNVNERRLDRGLERLRRDDSLVHCAEQQARRLVTEWRHSNAEEIDGCVSKVLGDGYWVLGECIGRAYNIEQVWKLLMQSDHHRRMLMQPKWDLITVGIHRTEDMVFVVIWVREVM